MKTIDKWCDKYIDESEDKADECFGVPEIMKNMIDRQLPMVLPFMTERTDGTGWFEKWYPAWKASGK